MNKQSRRSLAAGLLVFLIVAAVYLGFIFGAAQLDNAPATRNLIGAFESGALSDDSTRTIAPLTGLIVADSDQYSTCVPLSLALSPAEAVFGEGPWQTGTITCGSLREALVGAEGTQPWYRYWNGNAAILKVMLTFLPYVTVQVLVTLTLVVLLAVIAWRARHSSKTFAVGLVVILGFGSDLLWQGMSPGVGVSSVVGLAGALGVQEAFTRGWAARWGVVALAGFTYASTAQMHIPIAFAVMVGMVAMLHLLGRTSPVDWRLYMVGAVATVVWVGGYVIGLLTRYLWIAMNRGGISSVTGEVGTNSPYFLSESLSQALNGLLALLMRTWFAYGWLQIGLWFAFIIIGWSLAKGGARGWRNPEVFVAGLPLMAGVLWLLVWGRHTQHLFVNVLVSMIVLNVLFSLEVARRRAFDESGVFAQPNLVQEKTAQGTESVQAVSQAAPPVN